MSLPSVVGKDMTWGQSVNKDAPIEIERGLLLKVACVNYMDLKQLGNSMQIT